MKLKIGIAGLMRGKVYVDCFRKAGVEINAFCDANEQVLHQAGKKYNVSNLYSDYNEFLNSDIDAVVVVAEFAVGHIQRRGIDFQQAGIIARIAISPPFYNNMPEQVAGTARIKPDGIPVSNRRTSRPGPSADTVVIYRSQIDRIKIDAVRKIPIGYQGSVNGDSR